MTLEKTVGRSWNDWGRVLVKPKIWEQTFQRTQCPTTEDVNGGLREMWK